MPRRVSARSANETRRFHRAHSTNRPRRFTPELLLFDNGFGSINQDYPGKSRTYSAGRKYRIDGDARTATETWSFADKSIYSSICSSVYEDAPLNFLVNYSATDAYAGMELVGLNAAREKVFDYKYQVPVACMSGWNAVPVHLEQVNFNR